MILEVPSTFPLPQGWDQGLGARGAERGEREEARALLRFHRLVPSAL